MKRINKLLSEAFIADPKISIRKLNLGNPFDCGIFGASKEGFKKARSLITSIGTRNGLNIQFKK
jgi:hypothetical protein